MSNESSEIETLAGLVGLSRPFEAALAATFSGNGSYRSAFRGAFLRRKFSIAATPKEKQDRFDGLQEYNKVLSGGIETERDLRIALKMAETDAGVLQRVFSDRKIAKLLLVPRNYRTVKNAQALREAGYPNLARIHTPKP